MRDWMDRFKRRMDQWMIGRYGADEFSRFLFILGIILILIYSFTGIRILGLVTWLVIIYSYYRCMSRRIIKRSRERDIYLRTTEPVRRKWALVKRMWNDRNTHRYYKCPVCKKMIRVPKGKGRIAIKCPNCRNEIIKTT